MILFMKRTHPTRKLCIHFAYKNCKRYIELMYTKCMQNVNKMYTIFRQTFVYILYTKSKELHQLNFVYKMYGKVWRNFAYKHFVCILYTKFVEIKDTLCIQTFCIYFVCLLYTKCIQKFVEMWDTFYIATNILYTFFIHQLWST